MSPIDVVVAHQERVTVRVGEVFVKVFAEASRAARETEAIDHVAASVPVPDVLWRQDHAIALSAVPGEPLATLGVESNASPLAWRAAGAIARAIHDRPRPPWPGWTRDDYVRHLDRECSWLVGNGVVDGATVEAVRSNAEGALVSTDSTFIHGDLQAAHVLVDGDIVTGVIDWEDAEVGDPHYDIAVLTVGHDEHLDDVLTGYGADLDVDVIRAWHAYRRLVSVRWMIEHGYDATGDIASVVRTARS